MSRDRPIRVAIFADATPDSGVGHVMRCLAIAESMESEGAEVVWISQITVPWLRRYFKEKQCPMVEGPMKWVETLTKLIKFKIDIALIDTYENASDLITQMEQVGIHVVQIFDGFGVASFNASLVLNPEAPLSAAVSSTGRSLVLDGPEYALIRQEIRHLAQRRFESRLAASQTRERNRVPLVVVIAGGSDAEQLLDFPAWTAVAETLKSQVVFGPGGPEALNVQELSKAGGWVNIKSGSALLRDVAVADWVVSASGVTSWELMHIGVPTGLFCVADNQRRNFEYITSRGWALDMNDLVKNISGNFSAEPWRIARDYLARQPWQFQRIDGLGASRATAAVIKSFEGRNSKHS